MQQKEELMDEVEESVNNDVTELIEKFGQNSDPQAVYGLFTSTLPNIIGKGSDLEYDEVTGKAINRLKNHLDERYNDDQNSRNKILKLSHDFCDAKAKEIENKLRLQQINPSEREQSQKLADSYKLSANDLWCS